MGVRLGHHPGSHGRPLLLLLGRDGMLWVGRVLASRGHLGWHGRGRGRGRGSPGGPRRSLAGVVRGNRMERLGRKITLGLCLGLDWSRMRSPGGKRCLSRVLGGHSMLGIGPGGHRTLGVCLGLCLGLWVCGGHADDPWLDGAAAFGLLGGRCQPLWGRVGLGCCLKRRVGTLD